jgi:hypothetical protein
MKIGRRVAHGYSRSISKYSFQTELLFFRCVAATLRKMPFWSWIARLGSPPADDREAVILATLPVGRYPAIVRGKAGATGVALVEVYRLP